jgi:replicative DNA helicase
MTDAFQKTFSRATGKIDTMSITPQTQLDRVLPHSADAEAHIIACCLLDGNESIARVIGGGVNGDSFYNPQNRLLWATIADLWRSQPPVTIETLAAELQGKRLFETVGGYRRLMEITSGTPTTTHISFFTEKLLENQRLRDVIKASTAAIEKAYAFTGDLDSYLAEVSADFSRATGATAEAEERVQTVAGKLADEVDEMARTGKTPARKEASWGLLDLDQICGPMYAGELVVLGGRPSTGKSALADQVAWITAAKQGGDVVMFTYEMTKREKVIRIAQQLTGINYNGLTRAPKADVHRFTEAVRKVQNCPRLHVIERDTSVSRMVARCRLMASRGPLDLIVVDFLQYLARLEPMIGKERTDEKIGRITAALKDLARECNCPVLMLASLNREGEKENRPPRMSDLRASGEIESDADVIALLHWPMTTPDGQTQDPHEHGQNLFYVDFSQEKGRNKGVHQVGLHFNRSATKFQNYIR